MRDSAYPPTHAALEAIPAGRWGGSAIGDGTSPFAEDTPAQGVHEAVHCDARPEYRRRIAVRAVTALFLMSLAEGALRKWLLPGLAEPLTLLRDPFALALYAYCLANGLMRTGGLAGLWLGFALLTGIVGAFQYIAAGLPAQGWVLGVRSYWLYLPLAFVVAGCFTPADVQRFLRLCLWIALPYALLVIAQYDAPPDAWLNRGVGGTETGAVGLARGIVRPFGLFPYTGPNVQFATFMVAVFVAVAVSGPTRGGRLAGLLVAGTAVGAMAVLTGSRSIYFLAAAIVGATLLGMIAARPTRTSLHRAGTVLGFVAGAAGLMALAFPDMAAAMAERFARAAQSEGAISARVGDTLLGWVAPLGTAPLFGHGIGAGAPGVAARIGLSALPFGESDLERNVNELGVLFGLGLVALRAITALWVLRAAWRCACRGAPMALPLAGFAAPPLLMGQITHSPLTGFAVWLALGLVLALAGNRSQTGSQTGARMGGQMQARTGALGWR